MFTITCVGQGSSAHAFVNDSVTFGTIKIIINVTIAKVRINSIEG